jgi:imidazolonepropionase-like amidohydrolase
MQDRTTIIRAGRLIDGTTAGGVQRDQAIFVDSGTITRVVPAHEVPPDAEVIDLSTSTVLPGLIDCHVHLVFSASGYALGDVLAEDDQQLLLRAVAAAHGLGTDGIRDAVEAGVNTIEHCIWLGTDLSVSFDETVAHAMAERRIAFVPTLGPRPRPGAELRDQIVAAMRQAWALGVPIAAGTDAGVSNKPFDSLPEQLEIMVADLGLSPLEAIHAATAEAARAIGIADRVGTLEPGRAADLLVVDGDPSMQISDLRSVRMVIKGGRTVVENGVVLD